MTRVAAMNALPRCAPKDFLRGVRSKPTPSAMSLAAAFSLAVILGGGALCCISRTFLIAGARLVSTVSALMSSCFSEKSSSCQAG